jgi:hypothetical protein
MDLFKAHHPEADLLPGQSSHSGANASLSTQASLTPASYSRRFVTGRLRAW